jgi:hypothetical protein
MKGETIIVRAFRGRPLLRRVWEATPEVAYICTEERFQSLWRGEPDYPPSPFPRRDVFNYEPALFRELEANWQTDLSVWDRATPYIEEDEDEQEQADEDDGDDERAYRAA